MVMRNRSSNIYLLVLILISIPMSSFARADSDPYSRYVQPTNLLNLNEMRTDVSLQVRSDVGFFSLKETENRDEMVELTQNEKHWLQINLLGSFTLNAFAPNIDTSIQSSIGSSGILLFNTWRWVPLPNLKHLFSMGFFADIYGGMSIYKDWALGINTQLLMSKEITFTGLLYLESIEAYFVEHGWLKLNKLDYDFDTKLGLKFKIKKMQAKSFTIFFEGRISARSRLIGTVAGLSISL